MSMEMFKLMAQITLNNITYRGMNGGELGLIVSGLSKRVSRTRQKRSDALRKRMCFRLTSVMARPTSQKLGRHGRSNPA
jgi:hypothetical protein